MLNINASNNAKKLKSKLNKSSIERAIRPSFKLDLLTLNLLKRRNLFRGSLFAAGGATLTACSREKLEDNASSVLNDQPVVQWRMATSWPKNLDILFGGAEGICQQVSAMTNGRFTITPFAAEEIVPSFGVLDAVSDNIVECGHSASYYYFEKNPALAFGSTVPFGLNADQQNAWLHYGGGLEGMQEIYQDYGVINFPAGNTGVQMGGWFRKEIESLKDLQGLKMRIPGLGGEVMKRLGVDVKVYSADKIVAALLKGEIDAVEWNNPHDDEIMDSPMPRHITTTQAGGNPAQLTSCRSISPNGINFLPLIK